MRILPVFLAAAAVALPAAAAANAGDPGRGALAEARQATARYHDIDRALADGYVRVGDCVEEPGRGGMGYHYLNPALAEDPAIDPARPELLLYAPTANGGLRLVAVEYFRVDADQDVATDDDRPTLDGTPFEGPMHGHEPGMPIHYDLHAWIWKHNPSGTLSAYNPEIRC